MDEILAVEHGERASVLCCSAGDLKLDHFESLVRSGCAHGRTLEPPRETLEKLEVIGGCVTADAETVDYLAQLIVGEAQMYCSPVDAIPYGVIRHLAALVLLNSSEARRVEIAVMTDQECWMMLLTDPVAGGAADALRRDPLAWRAVISDGGAEEGTSYVVSRLYVDRPAVRGESAPAVVPAVFAELPALPWKCTILAPNGVLVPALPIQL